ncbi:Photosystem I P700 chlorophyll a apoprotein [Arachis hypogaea]|nr:Photosystem I P700 chlorophyll a apoprotein [Arachis hypogaea]
MHQDANYVFTRYFLAEIEGPEQKSDSEAEKGLQMLLEVLKVDFLELQKPNWIWEGMTVTSFKLASVGHSDRRKRINGSIIFLWLSGMYFHGARFSSYEAWLSDPTHIGPSAQVVWPIVGQEILNGDVGGGFRGIQITSGFFQIWQASGITSELQLYCTAIGALVFAALMLFAGWFHYHKADPKLAWFQDVESMLNHHLAGLFQHDREPTDD